jgi:uncharacterized integral membrane protein (TIGR00698 family)
MSLNVPADAFDSWDCMEGLPPPPVIAKDAPREPGVAGWIRFQGRHALVWAGERAPGFGLAAVLALLAQGIADWIGHSLLGYRNSPINGIPIAIVLGIALCNGIGIPSIFVEGLKACMRPLQRLAIILLGLRLSLGVVGGIGLQAMPAVVLSIAVALIFIPWLGLRVGLSRRLATLIAVGTSICGVSAIMATAPAIDAEEGEISYAVACVAIFGMLAMLTYPFVVPLLLGTNETAIGIFFGTAIHDTAQVTGAALTYQQTHQAPDVLNTATVVKIMRNLSMVAVIPLMAALFHRGGGAGQTLAKARSQIFPLFVFGFLAMTVVRTVGDISPRAFGLLDHATWMSFLGLMDRSSTWFLTVVMAAVGLSTGLASLKKLGMKPFFVGLTAALTVGAVGLGTIKALIALRS